MSFSTYTYAELIRRARTLFTGAKTVPGVTAALVPDFYDSTDEFDEGLALVGRMEDEMGKLSAEQREQYAATERAQALASDVRARYTAHRRMARRAYPRGSESYRALGLAGTAPDDRAGLYEAAGTFWRTIAEQPDLADSVRGLTPTRAQESLDLLETARQADDSQVKEAGDVDVAADTLSATVSALRASAGELAEAARLALTQQPQLQETLGLRARS
jgi:hypothetical protein